LTLEENRYVFGRVGSKELRYPELEGERTPEADGSNGVRPILNRLDFKLIHPGIVVLAFVDWVTTPFR